MDEELAGEPAEVGQEDLPDGSIRGDAGAGEPEPVRGRIPRPGGLSRGVFVAGLPSPAQLSGLARLSEVMAPYTRVERQMQAILKAANPWPTPVQVAGLSRLSQATATLASAQRSMQSVFTVTDRCSSLVGLSRLAGAGDQFRAAGLLSKAFIGKGAAASFLHVQQAAALTWAPPPTARLLGLAGLRLAPNVAGAAAALTGITATQTWLQSSVAAVHRYANGQLCRWVDAVRTGADRAWREFAGAALAAALRLRRLILGDEGPVESLDELAAQVEEFMTDWLEMRPDRRAPWRAEAVVAALLDPCWLPAPDADPTGQACLQALQARIRAEVAAAKPIWARLAGGYPVRDLYAPAPRTGLVLADTLHSPDAELSVEVAGVDDPRLRSLLRQLRPAERQVLYALAASPDLDLRLAWQDAAAAAGLPAAAGAATRRRCQYLRREIERRADLMAVPATR